MSNSINSIKVQVNKQQNQTVRELTYGLRSLKGSTDLNLTGAADQDVIVYQANTNSFVVKSVQNLNPDFDAGFF